MATIFHVEDSEFYREAVADICQHLGHVYLGAGTLKALDVLLKGNSPDGYILDNRFPEVPGGPKVPGGKPQAHAERAIQMIQAAHSKVPIIVLTTDPGELRDVKETYGVPVYEKGDRGALDAFLESL